jgi:uncharacterized damage-inducible protein DinB
MNAAQFFDHWQVVHRDLMRAVAMLKDADLEFRPADTYPRTVGDILRHMITLEKGWIHFVIRRQLHAWPETTDGRPNTVAEIRRELEETHQDTFNYLATIPVEDFNRMIQVPGDGTPKLGWILWHVFEQQIHHRGELFLCLSMLGYDRPKTDRPQ